MTAQRIPTDRIDLPKADPQFRTLCKEFTVRLADSIRVDGLVQPVVLRPNPAAPGRYVLVCGRHRYHAVAKVLKQKAIDAIVRNDLDEVAAERLALAENLWRSPLKKPQYERATRRWHQFYTAMFDGPSRVGRETGISGSEAAGPRTRSEGHDGVGY